MRTQLTRITTKYQVTIPKPARDAVGLLVGDFVETTVTREGLLLRPKVVMDKTTAKKVKVSRPTPAEIKALERARKEHARGEYVTLDQLVHDLGASHRKVRTKTN